MKRFYLLFLAIPLLAATILYLSVWWFAGGIIALMIFIAYQFYDSRLKAEQARKEVLEEELEDLHVQLEQAVLKEQRASKDAESVRLMKQELLSVISHEVRTPMNGIIGTALLMAETPLTKEQEEYMATIRNCGESLVTTVNNLLVNDILDLSKINQDGNKLEYKDFSLRDTIEEVLELFADKAGKANIDLLYNMNENVPEQIIGDTKRIRQILTNLVENAVKFTDQGEVLVSLHYTPHNDAGYPPEVRFEIKDTGVGMSKDQLKQLFKGMPGKNIKNADNDSGLGLVICKKLVELMGGSIDAASEPGQGSTVSFTIPITPSLKTLRSHARESEMKLLEGKNILIADESAAVRSILSDQFRSWKMVPVAANSAKEAMEVLSKNKGVNVVIADMALSGSDGLQFMKSIKEQNTSISIIGMKPAGDNKFGQDPGMFASILAKPFRQHILRDHILNVFTRTDDKQQTDSKQMTGLFAEQYPQNILIAEDNPVNQKIAVKVLSSLGYKPSLANNGKEAIELASNEKFDIILMDVQMPEMDGLEATRMIRTCLQVQPVIIAMTANVMQGDRDACMQAGMDDYMSKPIDLKELLNQLEKWYNASQEKRKASA